MIAKSARRAGRGGRNVSALGEVGAVAVADQLRGSVPPRRPRAHVPARAGSSRQDAVRECW
ncbi:hypothetical protein ACFPM0_14065 [Pseudonocardia sulfidoxydans]|uniref:hypothetical protein n=1 Tax=Pseudonocardia sulfidoxydans TaxID=54011 RepID=UPI00361C46AC